MANRLILGKNPSTATFQFRISKPGVNVLTAGVGDLLIWDNGTYGTIQKLQTGQVNVPGSTNVAVTWSNFGVVPFLFFRVDDVASSAAYIYPTLRVGYHSLTATGCTFQHAAGGTCTVHWFAWKI